MLTMHEKVKSEMRLRNNFRILFGFISVEFQKFVFTKVEHQERGDKTYDAAHTYV